VQVLKIDYTDLKPVCGRACESIPGYDVDSFTSETKRKIVANIRLQFNVNGEREFDVYLH